MAALDPQAIRRQKVPGALFGVLSLVIVVFMMAALKPSQPPPPPTAEYAPEAVQALRDAPQNQVSNTGTGDGEAGGGAAPPSPTPLPDGSFPDDPKNQAQNKAIEQNRVRQCIGNPPRQIEDPQSPPCVPYFDGDNGGATAPGVTANEIRVAMPAEEHGTITPRLLQFFNRRFEFYGRQLVIVPGTGCGGDTPNQMKACAERVASKNVFASLSYSDQGGNGYFFYDELARRKVVSIGFHQDLRYESHFEQFAPYQWGYLPSLDKMSRHIAELTCKQLAGKNATHAGEALQGLPRKFGLISNAYTNSASPDMTALKGALGACGIRDILHREVNFTKAGVNQRDETTTQQATNAMIDMAQADVTTLICMCHTSTTQQLTPAAESQGYQPEWIVSTFLYQDQDFWAATQPSGQWRHAFGLNFYNKWNAPVNMPWHWALMEVDPTYNYENNKFVYFGAFYNYHQLLMLAAGLQMAGPNLTPQTFQEGMWKTRFPNPDNPKVMAGKVGFEDRDHTFVNDAAIIWWNPAGKDEWYGANGHYCYVRNGQRNPLGRYPAEDEPFRPPCQRY